MTGTRQTGTGAGEPNREHKPFTNSRVCLVVGVFTTPILKANGQGKEILMLTQLVFVSEE